MLGRRVLLLPHLVAELFGFVLQPLLLIGKILGLLLDVGRVALLLLLPAERLALLIGLLLLIDQLLQLVGCVLTGILPGLAGLLGLLVLLRAVALGRPLRLVLHLLDQRLHGPPGDLNVVAGVSEAGFELECILVKTHSLFDGRECPARVLLPVADALTE